MILIEADVHLAFLGRQCVAAESIPDFLREVERR